MGYKLNCSTNTIYNGKPINFNEHHNNLERKDYDKIIQQKQE